MKNLILSFGLILAPLISFADVQYFRIDDGKVMAYEYLAAKSAKGTLVLLPGVNRSLSTQEPAVIDLQSKGWNILLPSLPSHPLSIRGLADNESAEFDSETRVHDYTTNLEALIASLGIQNAIPVSLSYSSSLSAYLSPDAFPHVIDTVPLVTSTETNPTAAAYAAQMEAMAMLNPFLGPIWVRNFRDMNYRNHWQSTVYGNLAMNSEFYGPSPRTSDIVNGYVAIARAIEDFDFAQIDFSQTTQTRDFVLGGKEDSLRLKKQIQVLANYIATGKPCRIVVVAESGHVLPSEEPQVYAQLIDLLAQQAPAYAASVQFAVINAQESGKTPNWQGFEAFSVWANSVLK